MRISHIAIAVLCTIYSLYVSIGYFRYAKPNLKSLLKVMQCNNEAEIVAALGRAPDQVFFKNDSVPQQGWRTPKKVITNKLLIYDNDTSFRIYIYINESEELEYVYATYS